jgi:hypothetical protein
MKSEGHCRRGDASFFVLWQIIWLTAKKVLLLRLKIMDK